MHTYYVVWTEDSLGNWPLRDSSAGFNDSLEEDNDWGLKLILQLPFYQLQVRLSQ